MTTFDPAVYTQIAATSPEAAASYLQATTGTPAGTSPVTSSNPPPAAAAQPQAQGQFSRNPAAVQPQPVLARGTLEDFYNQPTGGGGGPSVTSKFFNKRVNESWLDLLVSSDVTNADVRQQTDPSGKPQTFKDGKLSSCSSSRCRCSGLRTARMSLSSLTVSAPSGSRANSRTNFAGPWLPQVTPLAIRRQGLAWSCSPMVSAHPGP